MSFTFNAFLEENGECKSRLVYDKADYQKMKDSMNINWEERLLGESVNSQWNIFKKQFDDAVEKYVPRKTVKVNNRKKGIPFNGKAKSKINRKRHLWQRYLNTGDESVKLEYQRVSNQVKSICRKVTKVREKNIANSVKDNPKKFWAYVKTKTKTKTSIPNLYTDDNKSELSETDQGKADILADFFTSVFTEENNDDMPNIDLKDSPPLEEISFTEETVKKKLDKLKISKSPGPDSIHPRVLNELADIIAKPLSIIFETSVTESRLPEDWKCANITAIHKKGDRKVAGNYRPVSLTCIACKLLETIIREHIMNHMKRNKLFSTQQFGFISGRSTVLQLLQVIDKWTEILDRGGCIDITYMDFMKAFDKVPHKRLLHKLKMYKIGEKYTKWLEAFLIGRKQRVIVNNESSSWRDVTSGIPQGSVMGPVLFVLYINDLPESAAYNSDTFLYADDTKIFREINSVNDCEDLQTDIFALHKWSEKWLLRFHPEKCKTMRIGNSKTEKYSYRLKETLPAMDYVENEKDIGVVIDNCLSFKDHILEKVNKSNSIMGVINRTYEYLDTTSFKLLYTALVRPHIEYANQVWSPQLKKYIDMVENVQRRATRVIPGLSNLSYADRLKTLKLPTLAYRRARGDMIELYKIVTGKYDAEVSTFIKTQPEHSTRGHKYKIYKQRPRLNIRKNSFCFRTVDVWNNLPNSVVEADTVKSFESRLDKHWDKQPLKYDYTATISTTEHDLERPRISKPKAVLEGR